MTDGPREATCRVTVLVVTWQGRDLLPPCLDSLARQTVPHRVVVVDNASTDGTAELLADRYPHVRVVRNPENRGFAGGVAAGLAVVDTPLVALLNNDAVAEPDWLAHLVASLDTHPEAAAVTSRLLLADVRPPTLNNAGVVLLDDGYGADRGLGAPADQFPEPDEVFGFSGGAALLRLDAVRGVGGFPEPFFLYYEDTDTSWRLRQAGWSVRYEPSAVVHHRHSATADQTSADFAYWNERNRLLMHVRCAPATAAMAVWARFLLTTISLLGRRLTGAPRPAAHQQRLRLRLRTLGGAVRLLPWALRSRRRTG
ncbi:glycosyltransferase family 2 protein [Blastococcus capsensis]|uniref:glycosyltransferase family 2 protein n=1 Tax=Blastococcus capsensis TaxID=1564163 RepID=UPI002540EACC|nr:glycosyltransferase family 2 protein [Blastococcus capsensis]MDK3256143.1 glycosyltransferase family 2 protein [Blastococcus capsensis]